MQERSSDPEALGDVEGLVARFERDPGDRRAFERVEEQLFMLGEWDLLRTVYEARLGVMASGTAERADMLLRLARLLEERLDQPDTAQQRYEELLRVDPVHADGLNRLRNLYARQGQLMSAVQIGEAEERLPRPAREQARMLAETGDLWLRLGEAAEAEPRFQRALELDARSGPARAGLAALAAVQGEPDRARRMFDDCLPQLRGAVRLDALERYVELLPDSDASLRKLLGELVKARPSRRPIERLVGLELAAGRWRRVDELYETLWSELDDDDARKELVLAATTAQLEGPGDAAAALAWLDRGTELLPDDPDIQRLRERVARRAGNADELIGALAELNRIEGPSTMRTLEMAVIHEHDGQPERAIPVLHQLLEHDPTDTEALAVLERCLGRLGRHAERASVLEQHLQLAGDDQEYGAVATALGDALWRELDEPGAAEQLYRGVLARCGSFEPAADQLKELYYKTERYEELDQFLEGLASEAQDAARRAREWTQLGELRLAQRGDATGAQQAFLRAIEADPDCLEALNGLRRTGEPSEADRLPLSLRELDPEDASTPEVMARRFTAAREAGDLTTARQVAERWADLAGDPASLLALAGVARQQEDAEAERGALDRLETLLHDQPEQRARALTRLGDLALAQPDAGAPERAALRYVAAMELRPDEDVRGKLIDIYRCTGQLAELAVHLEARIELQGDEASSGVRVQLARTHAELGDPERAIETLRPAFDRNPADADVADLLEGYLAAGEALEDLASVLGRRLAREREPARRREIAHRLGAVLLDGLGRAEDAVAAMRELADPSRQAPLEELFDRALETADACPEHETWLVVRESHLEGKARARMGLRLADLQREQGRSDDAIATLRRVARGVPPERAEAVQRQLLALLEETGDGEGQLEVLDALARAGSEPAARAHYLLLRARLLIDELGRPIDGISVLDAIDHPGQLRVPDLRLMLALSERAANATTQVRALSVLAERADDQVERLGARSQLAQLLSEGPEEVRDPVAAERVLREILHDQPDADQIFEQLVGLLARTEQADKLAALLGDELERESLTAEEHASLALRLANLLDRDGDHAQAAVVLERARERCGPTAAIDELLYRAYEQLSDTESCRALCEQKVAQGGRERSCWLRRWWQVADELQTSPAERLSVLERVLEAEPRDPDLVATRLELLRIAGPPEDLAQGLEESLAARVRFGPGRRRACVRELLRLYRGPLDDPMRALTLAERELENDPDLRRLAVALAEQVEDPAREAALLSPLVQGRVDDAEPPDVRRLGLTLAAGERDADAEPLLWRALENQANDREVLRALEGIAARRDDGAELLQLLELRYPLESASERAQTARNALLVLEGLGDPQQSLRWMRRWHALEDLPRARVERWLEMETAAGDRRGQLQVLRRLRKDIDDDEESAPMFAREADLLVEAGHLDLAREAYEEALRRSGRPPAAWLSALDALLAGGGRTLRRSGVLRDLTRHPDLTPEERERYRELRVELLASHADLREEAVAELAKLVERDLREGSPQRVGRMRTLLRLYDELERRADWCDVAEQLLGELSGGERDELERALARRLAAHSLSRERAIAVWKRISQRDPQEEEALRALAGLLDYPGCELQRAEVLERLASSADRPDVVRWVEAAHLRWTALRDAPRALANLEHALLASPADTAAHRLRVDLCAHLERPAEESASLELLLDRDPEHPEAGARWLRLAQLHSASPEERDDAIRAAERALAAGGGSAELCAGARRVFERAGAFERACLVLRDEIQGSEPDRRPALLRQLARLEWQERGRAEACCDALIELETHGPLEAADELCFAEALRQLERWPEFVTRQGRALEARTDGGAGQDWLELARLASERTPDVEAARAACTRALSRDPELIPALELRAELFARAGAFADEIDDRVTLARVQADDRDSALAYTHAARVASEHLADDTRAWALYRSALKRDPAALDALLGAGKIAAERGEWSEAERMFGEASALLAGQSRASELAGVAQQAARAALEQHRDSEGLEYLERALGAEPRDPEALDTMSQLALRLGAPERARECLEMRLALGDLEGEERAERLVRLSQACESQGDLAGAADALDRVIELRGDDEVSRARVVELLERLEDPSRAVAQLEAWIARAPEERRSELSLRAARLEISLGERAAARERLGGLVAGGSAPGAVWLELAELVHADEGAEAARGVTEQALASGDSEGRAALLWLDARALRELGRPGEAGQRALEALRADPHNLDAAQLLAEQLGRVEDRHEAVDLLERALDLAPARGPLQAEISEALGRTYAGPLEQLDRAERCYRRALQANSERTSAREALADVTAFDPAAHRESVHLHRELLGAFPARPGSWRAIAQIAEHWNRDRAASTCRLVLDALRLSMAQGPDPHERPLVHTGTSEDSAVCAATELLHALNEANQLPDVSQSERERWQMPMPMHIELAELAGPGWELSDEQLAAIWRQPAEASALSGELSRRRRRQLKRALKDSNRELLRELQVGPWRDELLAQAAALAIHKGSLSLPDALHALLAVTPETSGLRTDTGGSMPAIIQGSPSASGLLLRIADTTLGALGL